jgi:site-specific DNA-cytosine methylase
LKIKHHFSVEIEAMKQSYIERNFSPPLIFKDVREFIPEASFTAMTAYGAEARIPAGIDILIAGFVCKDLSQLNSNRKTLDDDGESGDTFRAIYAYSKNFRPGVVLLENVQGQPPVWREIVAKWDEIGYEAAWTTRDTKEYYLPQTRMRMYMIVVDQRVYGDSAKNIVSKWKDLMQKLERRCSSPYESFLRNMASNSNKHNSLASEPDWALCKLRYDHIRSKERLGILRPVTRWNENGMVR